MNLYILISDVGMNGYVIHGVYDTPPSPEVIALAKEFTRGWTGYAGTTVEERRLNGSLPCGGECTRPKENSTWADCWCYVHDANGRLH